MKSDEIRFEEAVTGLLAGDFSRLAPLFADDLPEANQPCSILAWYEQGLFANEPQALVEALTCACFNGCTLVAAYLLQRGVSAEAGNATGLNALHWAANRGQLAAVRLLLQHQAALETRNMYGGTVLGTTAWSAIHEPRADHLQIIETLLNAGACVEEVEFPTGNELIDELLRRYRAVA